MPQNEDIALFIGIHRMYLLYRRQTLERSFQLLCAPVAQRLHCALTSSLGVWETCLQEGYKVIDRLQQLLKVGLLFATTRSEEAQYTPGVSPTPANEESHNRRLDWARCLLDWSKSCMEWVDTFENGLKAMNEHRRTLQARQMRRRDEIARLQLNTDGLGSMMKMNAVMDENRADVAIFHAGLQRLRESVCFMCSLCVVILL